MAEFPYELQNKVGKEIPESCWERQFIISVVVYFVCILQPLTRGMLIITGYVRNSVVRADDQFGGLLPGRLKPQQSPTDSTWSTHAVILSRSFDRWWGRNGINRPPLCWSRGDREAHTIKEPCAATSCSTKARHTGQLFVRRVRN